MARKITVLLVEDDYIVREALEHALAQENYHVLTAASLAAALPLLETGTIQIILIDSELSLCDHAQFFIKVKERQPLVSMIVMTADDSFVPTFPGVAVLVEKPLNFPDLFGKIEELANGDLKGSQPIAQRVR